MAKYNYGPRRGLKRKQTLADSQRSQGGVGSSYNSSNPPTKDTPMRDRAVSNPPRPVDTGQRRPSRRAPNGKFMSYTLPPGPRGDSPSGTYNQGRGHGRTGDMQYGYNATEKGQRERRFARRRKLPAWHRDAVRNY